MQEFKVDSKAEYSALSSTRSQKKENKTNNTSIKSIHVTQRKLLTAPITDEREQYLEQCNDGIIITIHHHYLYQPQLTFYCQFYVTCTGSVHVRLTRDLLHPHSPTSSNLSASVVFKDFVAQPQEIFHTALGLSICRWLFSSVTRLFVAPCNCETQTQQCPSKAQLKSSVIQLCNVFKHWETLCADCH